MTAASRDAGLWVSVRVVGALRRLSDHVWSGGARLTPPLDPVDQDPESVRDQACQLTADARVCRPPDDAPPPPRPSQEGGSSNGDFGSLVSLLLWVLFIGMVVAVVVLVVRALIEGRGGGGRRRRSATHDDDADDDGEEELRPVAIDRSVEPTGWRADAERFRREGRYRDALRCRYRALVGDLARRGYIDEIPGRTTGEERAQLEVVSPAASPSFDGAADLFDGAWYGNLPVGADDDDRFQRLEADVLAVAAPQRAGGRR